MAKVGFQIKVTGLVQGVGFRPFIYRIAHLFGLSGYVRNQRDGVRIVVEGEREGFNAFYSFLTTRTPPASQIFNLTVKRVPVTGYPGFRIEKSRSRKKGELFVPPDLSPCFQCLEEMANPSNRRYRYPFINCTNCGPRYSIIFDLPYDRKRTVMKEFDLCPDCLREYKDPLNRRYHAEPIACPVCGPQVFLKRAGKIIASREEAIKSAGEALKEGKILAVKGIGGFHLMCDATNETAVQTLRKRKQRPTKPLAVMAESVREVRRYAHLSREAEKVLTSPARPILLLKKRAEGKATIAPSVSPDNDYFGLFLAYAPLHFLLLKEGVSPLVATSANLSEEPIMIDNQEVEEKLLGIADYFLIHNRQIVHRCDDSILLPFTHTLPPVFLRRSRGFVPLPILTRKRFLPSLAFGGEEKGTFAFASGNTVFPSPYLGDLKRYENLKFFEETLACYQTFFRIKPEFLAADLHPDYQSRLSAERMSLEKKIPLFTIQHHKAHLASVFAEKDIKGQVIGCAFDGTGYGEDGTLWGGEFFCGDAKSLERSASLLPFLLPGGDQAVHHPWRTALSLLHASLGPSLPEIPSLEKVPEEKNLILKVLASNYPFIKTSSAGRLFDGISALLGLCFYQGYDAEAPVRLQDSAERADSLLSHLKPYSFAFQEEGALLRIDWRPMVEEIVKELKAGKAVETLAARFHLTVTEIIFQTCLYLSKKSRINVVILSGGVFQNRLLLRLTYQKLSSAGLNVLLPEKLPINDGGLCLGQLLLAQTACA